MATITQWSATAAQYSELGIRHKRFSKNRFHPFKNDVLLGTSSARQGSYFFHQSGLSRKATLAHPAGSKRNPQFCHPIKYVSSYPKRYFTSYFTASCRILYPFKKYRHRTRYPMDNKIRYQDVLHGHHCDRG